MTGIGFRRELASQIIEGKYDVDFIEAAPENWIGIGGYWLKQFRMAIEKYPLYTHGLSLSLGSTEPLDLIFLRKIRDFLSETNALLYSEHLSFSKTDNAHFYDLLPIPFTIEAVKHVSGRIMQVQDYLKRPIAVEIVSYYSAISPEMSEIEFINEILETADCDLLLDINNIYVNGFNHSYDPVGFINQLPLHRVKYIHMAGHLKVSDTLIIDTHGTPIADPVYGLFFNTLKKIDRNIPVLLERDFNIPATDELSNELFRLKMLQNNALTDKKVLYAQ